MAVIEGEQALIRLNSIMISRDDPDDVGFLGEGGEEHDRVTGAIRKAVEKSGKAARGSVSITLTYAGHRNENGEIEVKVEAGVTSKSPAHQKRSKRVFLDHDGTAHTAPVQEDLPIMGIKGSVDGGKKDAPVAVQKKTV